MLSNRPTTILIYFFVCLLTFCSIPLGYGNAVKSSTPPPVEKKKTKKRVKKQRKKRFKLTKKAKKSIKTAAIVIAIIALTFLILGAFLIGFGITIWSLIAYGMLGAEILGFGIPFLLLLGTSNMTTMTFTTLLFVSYLFINIIIGLGFFIWGLAIAWPFGWMIGLIMLGFAFLMILVFLFAILLRS